MRINQRNDAELTDALAKVDAALLEDVKAGGRAKKSTVLRVLSSMGFCSAGSAGIEHSFHYCLSEKNLIGPTSAFDQLMRGRNVTVPATTERASDAQQEPARPAATTTAATPAEGPGDFTVVNLKGVSLVQGKNGRTNIRFIGSDEGLIGDIDVQSLRSNCNLLEFAI